MLSLLYHIRPDQLQEEAKGDNKIEEQRISRIDLATWIKQRVLGFVWQIY